MRTHASFTLSATSILGLALTLACGGGGGGGGGSTNPPPPPKTIADTLTYTDPSSTGFRLVRNSTFSSASRLVLDLVGPSGTGQGVAVILSSDQTKVTWSTPPSASGPVANVAFSLGSGTQALVAKVTGDQLQGGAFQKPGTGAVNLAQPLLRFSLDLKSGVPVNSTVPISFVSGNQLPASGGPSNITVAVGSLIAQ